MYQRIIESTETYSGISSAQNSETLDLGGGVREGSIQINITASGVSGAQLVFQVSNDAVTWFQHGVASAITTSSSVLQQFTSIPCRYMRVRYTTSAGTLTVTQINYFRGEQV